MRTLSATHRVLAVAVSSGRSRDCLSMCSSDLLRHELVSCVFNDARPPTYGSVRDEAQILTSTAAALAYAESDQPAPRESRLLLFRVQVGAAEC